MVLEFTAKLRFLLSIDSSVFVNSVDDIFKTHRSFHLIQNTHLHCPLGINGALKYAYHYHPPGKDKIPNDFLSSHSDLFNRCWAQSMDSRNPWIA